MGKLFLFKARDVPVVLIVRTANKRNQWQLIRWDLESDHLISGQWLLHKQLWVDGCAISPCGKYFYWVYNTYQNIGDQTHAGISLIPTFTALMYGNKGIGRYNLARYDTKTSKPINAHGLEPRTEMIECVDPTEVSHVVNKYGELQPDCLPNGLMSNSWIDFKQRHITTIDYKIFINGVEFADFSNNTFEPVSPVDPIIEL